MIRFIKGHESRRGETVAMETMMKKLGLQIVKMREPGTMDGGDVLFTGREFFVGLSKRTNQVSINSTFTNCPRLLWHDRSTFLLSLLPPFLSLPHPLSFSLSPSSTLLTISPTSSLLSHPLVPIHKSTGHRQSGLDQLASAFPDYPVIGVPVEEGLHLKSFVSMAGPDCIAIGMSLAAKDARKIIETQGKFKYQFIEVPDDIGANCLYVNGTLIHIAREDYPRSYRVFENIPTQKKISLSTSELNKVDGCFTCCSVLIN